MFDAALRVPEDRALVADAATAAVALEENLWSLWSRFGRGDGCRLHHAAAASWYATPIPQPPYQGVLRLGAGGTATSAATRESIDRLARWFARRGKSPLWMVPPSAPVVARRRLLAHGFAEVEVATGMWIDLAALPPPPKLPGGLALRQVVSAADLDRFLSLVRWRWRVDERHRAALAGIARGFAFTVPASGVRAWLVTAGGQPLAKAVLHTAGGVAGLYAVATVPHARGQGLARVLTLHALAVARAEGLRLGVLHATPMAHGLYARLGFRALGSFGLLAAPGRLHV
jgi:GNAT superfamily N-acetyltransferase